MNKQMKFTMYLMLLLSVFNYEARVEAQTSKIKEYNLGKNNLALEGYDAVSYFQKEGPKKGNKDFQIISEGVRYLFSSKQNMEAFRANPEKYKPTFGGWCAYAMGANGTKYKVIPDNYKIVDGKLNLFYKTLFSNTLDNWNKDENRLKKQAVKNWAKLNK